MHRPPPTEARASRKPRAGIGHPAVWLSLACVALACGGSSSRSVTGGRGGGSGAGAGGDDSAGASGGAPAGSSGEAAAAGSCTNPNAAPLPERPSEAGCYESVDGGFRRVACNCELLVDNLETGRVMVSLSLSLLNTELTPALGGSPEVELAIDDENGSFFDVWSRQPDHGSSFLVTSDAGVTRVRLGVKQLELDAAPMAACDSRVGLARIRGATSSKLEMRATLANDAGTELAVVESACLDLPRP